jgi:hypothetical protein
MAEIEPDLVADITLYRTEDGGRLHPLRGDLTKYSGFPCKINKEDLEAWDCRILLEGKIIKPGESHRLKMAFISSTHVVPLLVKAGHFYLWEAKIIGEARVVNLVQNS